MGFQDGAHLRESCPQAYGLICFVNYDHQIYDSKTMCHFAITAFMSFERNFDPMRDQHPVTWVLEKLQPGVYEPLMQWLQSVDPDCVILPSSFTMPDC